MAAIWHMIHCTMAQFKQYLGRIIILFIFGFYGNQHQPIAFSEYISIHIKRVWLCGQNGRLIAILLWIEVLLYGNYFFGVSSKIGQFWARGARILKIQQRYLNVTGLKNKWTSFGVFGKAPTLSNTVQTKKALGIQ